MAETKLVGGFNPFEKHWSIWESSPNRGENKNYLKPPPRKVNRRVVINADQNPTKADQI